MLHSKGEGLSLRAMSGALAVVIDLSRLPSHGRAVAAWLRGSKSTRQIPIVFVGGDASKVDALKKEIPDAVFTTLPHAVLAVRKAVESPRNLNPVTPAQMMASTRSTAQKLGIAAGTRVRLIDPPSNYENVLGELPEGVQFHEDGACPVTLWFVRERGEFAAGLARRRGLAVGSKFWIVWKKGQANFNGNAVRQTALAMGLVDYKICSLDAVWSGILFAVKKG